MIQIFIANYIPEYVDGRVKRIQGLEEHLMDNRINYEVISFGPAEDLSGKLKKLKSYAIKYFYMPPVRPRPGPRVVSTPPLVSNIVKFLVKKVSIPDVFIFDTILNYVKVSRILKQHATVIISAPWFSLLLYSRIFKNNYLIIDLRDLYLENPIFHKSHIIDRFIFIFSVRYADEIWVTTESACRFLRKSVNKRIRVIPNGVSDQVKDAILLCRSRTQRSAHREITIGYFGNLGGNRRFNGFFKDICSIENVRMIAAGNFDQDHQDIFGLNYLGFLDQEALYQTMSHCDILTVCITKDEHSDYAIPAKIYEALCFGVPILLIAPPNSAAENFLVSLKYPHLTLAANKAIDFELLCELAKQPCDPIIVSRSRIFDGALANRKVSTPEDTRLDATE